MRPATLACGVLAVCVSGGVTGALAQTLEGVSASNCNFANTVFGEQGQRQIQINLAPADQYNYGEVYGQIYFDFRRKGASQTPENWFAGFRRALVSTGLFSEDREYVLMVTAYGNLFDGTANVNRRVELGKQIMYRFRSGRDGNIQLLGNNIQSGARKAVTITQREGLFTFDSAV